MIAPGVWVHTSHGNVPGLGSFPSNGLVVMGTKGAVLVDTAWGLDATAELLDWVERNVGGVHAVVVTHWHDDRAGGLPEVHRRGIASYAFSKTIEDAAKHNAPLPERSLRAVDSLASLGVAAETFYPGPGHTDDNIVVWLPSTQVLFGGCLVKSSSSTSLGNVADATVSEWSSSVQKVQERYPRTRIVVPGHGAPGGILLLEHTRSLADASTTTEIK
jgi:metallo-beta-lactamase class B